MAENDIKASENRDEISFAASSRFRHSHIVAAKEISLRRINSIIQALTLLICLGSRG